MIKCSYQTKGGNIMKKTTKKLLSILLSALMLLPFSAVAFAADGDYTINSPYADVIWEGENAWGAYKGDRKSVV